MQYTDIPMCSIVEDQAPDAGIHQEVRRFVSSLLGVRLDWVLTESLEGGVRVSVPDSIDTSGSVLRWVHRLTRAVDFAVTAAADTSLHNELYEHARLIDGWAEAADSAYDVEHVPTLYVRVALTPRDRDAWTGDRIDEDAPTDGG